MNKKNSRIAIIGGGLSGLITAEGLQRKGYKNVTVFEKDLALGGKLNTIWYKGRSYELGAIFGLPSYANLKVLMERLNIKADGPKLSRTNYNCKGEKIMPILKEDIQGFVEELSRLPKILSEYKSLESSHIKDIEPMLMQAFSKWCDVHNLKILKTIYVHYFTVFGLGNINEVPAIYVLRIMSYEHLMSFMDIPRFYTWNKGVSILAKTLEEKIKDIRLGQEVVDISLSSNNTLFIKTTFEEIEFDKVIITAALEQFSHLTFWDEEMRDYLGKIKYQEFNTYAFIVDGVLKGCGSILENLSPDRRGHIILWDARWNLINEDEKLVVLYAYDPPKDSKIPSIEYIKDDLIKLGVKKSRLYQARRWKHCPYVDTPTLEQGFYKKMDVMQGENNIFLSGEIMNILSIENCIKNSENLLERFF